MTQCHLLALQKHLGWVLQHYCCCTHTLKQLDSFECRLAILWNHTGHTYTHTFNSQHNVRLLCDKDSIAIAIVLAALCREGRCLSNMSLVDVTSRMS